MKSVSISIYKNTYLPKYLYVYNIYIYTYIYIYIHIYIFTDRQV